MKIAAMIKGQNGRWRLQVNFFNLYITFSNTPVRFKSRQDAFIKQNERQKLKLMLLAQRGNKCESCGHGGNEKFLELHHIKPIVERPDLAKSPDNIMLLCNGCHKRIHKELSRNVNLFSKEI